MARSRSINSISDQSNAREMLLIGLHQAIYLRRVKSFPTSLIIIGSHYTTVQEGSHCNAWFLGSFCKMVVVAVSAKFQRCEKTMQQFWYREKTRKGYLPNFHLWISLFYTILNMKYCYPEAEYSPN